MGKIKEFITSNLKWAILLLTMIGFVVIAENVFSKELMSIDIVGYNLISKYIISDSLTPLVKVITNLGGKILIISITILVSIILRKKKIGRYIVLNLGIATALNIILKNILRRPRPNELRLIHETGYSFPSGHSMVSMAFYGFFIYLIYKYVKDKKIKILLICALIILIISIGITRIYLGVHYTSDVLAGFLISVSYLILYTSIIDRYLPK